MSSFTDPLKLKLLPGGRDFELTESFSYYTDVLGEQVHVFIPYGFVTDFASVPRLLWSVAPPIGRHSKPSVVHDYLYCIDSKVKCTRRQADKVFLEAMKVTKTGWFTRTTYYLAVRMFGWLFYRRKTIWKVGK